MNDAQSVKKFIYPLTSHFIWIINSAKRDDTMQYEEVTQNSFQYIKHVYLNDGGLKIKSRSYFV